MADPLRVLEVPFLQRIRATRAWGHVAFRMRRGAVTAAIALVPLVLLVVLAWAWPDAGRILTEPTRVRAVFERFVSGIITAATIAVSFATLALRRGLRGIGSLRRHREEDAEYRRDVHGHLREGVLPTEIGLFLADSLDGVARRAREARAVLSPDEAAVTFRGARLDDYLGTVEARAHAIAETTRRAHERPDALFQASLDFESDHASHLARGFARHEGLSARTREAIDGVEAIVEDVAIAQAYIKTLDIQWGLSRMSRIIALSSLAGIFASVAMVFGYVGEVRAAAGLVGSAALVGAALFLALLPLAAFVSHALRFVFVNEYSLPLGTFVLGPEREVKRGGQRRPARG